MANNLNLRAGVKDDASPVLKKIRTAIKDVGEQPGIKNLTKSMDKLREGFSPLAAGAEAGKGALLAMGFSALSLAGIFEGLRRSVEGVGDSSKNLDLLSRSTGASVVELQKWEQAGKRFGITAGQMDDAFKRANQQRNLWAHGQGNLAQIGAANPALAASLKNAKSALEVVRLESAAIAATKPEQRQALADALGNPALAAIDNVRKLQEYLAQAKTLSPDDVQIGSAFADSMMHLEDVLDNVKNKVGVTIIPGILGPIKELGDYIEAHSKDISDGVGAAVHWLTDPATIQGIKDFGAGVKTVAGDVDDVAKAFGGWKTTLEGVAAAWLAIKAAGIVGGKGGLLNKSTGVLLGLGVAAEQFAEGDARYHAEHGNTQATVYGRGGAALGRPGRVRNPYAGSDGATIQGNPANAGALADALKKKAEEIGAKVGDSTGDTLTRPGGTGEKFGKQVGKSFTESLSNLLGLSAAASELGNGDGTASSSAGGVAIKGRIGGAGRKRAGGGQLYSNARDGGGAAIHARGNVARNQKLAYDALRGEGLSDQAAKVFVANVSSEALSNPGDVHFDSNGHGGGHTARGIVQWDPARAEAIKRQFGKYPNEMSVAEQMHAAAWEIKNNPRFKATWNALHGKGLSDAQMMDTVVRNYEAPARPDKDVQYRLRLLRGLPPSLSDAVKADKAAKQSMNTVTPSTPTHQLAVNVIAPRDTKVDVADTGLFSNIQINRRFHNRELA